MLNTLIQFDFLATRLINGLIPHHRFFDLLFSFFSLRGISVFIWIILLIVAIILEERKNPGISQRDKKFILYFTISFLTTAFLVNIVIKNLVKRPRPSLTKAPLTLFTDRTKLSISHSTSPSTCPHDYSFPSGHASTSFAAATVLAAFDKKRKWFYYGVATLISISRIYLGCHYFLDVVGGIIIGYVISRLSLTYLGKIFLR
jgi:undecaprenyl-diphosphatase